MKFRREDLVPGVLDKFTFRTFVVCVRPDDARIIGFARSKAAAEPILERALEHADAGDVITTLTVCDHNQPPWWNDPEKLRERLVELVEETFS